MSSNSNSILVLLIVYVKLSFICLTKRVSSPLLRHVLKRLFQVLLAERKLADGPDFGILGSDTCS